MNRVWLDSIASSETDLRVFKPWKLQFISRLRFTKFKFKTVNFIVKTK